MTTLYLTQRAFKQIDQAVKKQPLVETGGILMGLQLEKGDYIVSYASEPGPRAIQTRNTIMFDDPYLRELVRKIRRRTAGRLQYVGDWHSHTVKRLSPSKGDRETILSKHTNNLYASSSPLMLIAGLDKRHQLLARAFILADSFREVDQIQLYQKQVNRPLF
ncbi:Mov34/MPN/PAD-1 family protein [Brevibacillus ginsengisoli]|uniref:Mov34/MPN/PAD-1 family protein n=1 Tax=Brevibacillus ginsengisoli TaxID=363854 RepID=UPI003CF4EDF7